MAGLCLGLSLGFGAPATAAADSAPLVVEKDRGGAIAFRAARVTALSRNGQRVELRGTCLSACTLYLAVPQTCVAPEAQLGFHGPRRRGQSLTPSEFEHWSHLMAEHYREPLRQWFMSTARHRSRGYHRVSGRELIRMGYRSC